MEEKEMIVPTFTQPEIDRLRKLIDTPEAAPDPVPTDTEEATAVLKVDGATTPAPELLQAVIAHSKQMTVTDKLNLAALARAKGQTLDGTDISLALFDLVNQHDPRVAALFQPSQS
jgi:hypothetical protein